MQVALEKESDAIQAAERLIYIETQYFSSTRIRDALVERMQDQGKSKLEIVVVVNERAEAYYRFPEGQKSFMGYEQLRVWARGRGEGWGQGGPLLEVKKDPNPPPGSSGLQLRVQVRHVHLLEVTAQLGGATPEGLGAAEVVHRSALGDRHQRYRLRPLLDQERPGGIEPVLAQHGSPQDEAAAREEAEDLVLQIWILAALQLRPQLKRVAVQPPQARDPHLPHSPALHSLASIGVELTPFPFSLEVRHLDQGAIGALRGSLVAVLVPTGLLTAVGVAVTVVRFGSPTDAEIANACGLKGPTAGNDVLDNVFDDNTVDIVVRVHDVWTLSPGLSFGRKGGENSTRFKLEDANFFGFGKIFNLNHSFTLPKAH